MKGIIVIFLIIFIVSCSTFPHKDINSNNISLVVFKANLFGGATNIISGFIFTGDPAYIDIMNINTEEIYKSTYLENKFCFIPNVPYGEYKILNAKYYGFQNTITVNFDEIEHKFSVDSEVTYEGEFNIDLGANFSLIYSDLKVKKIKKIINNYDDNLLKLKDLINNKYYKKGWSF